MRATDLDVRRLARRRAGWDLAQVTGTRPGISLIECRDSTVRIRDVGQGPAAIFFADPPTVVENYDDLIAELSGSYRVIGVEAPGFGFSYPRASFDFTRRAYADVAIDLLEKLNCGPAALFLPCVAAYYGVEVAARRPDLVSRLFLAQGTDWKSECVWAQGVVKGFTLLTSKIPAGQHVSRVPYLGQAIWALTEKRFPKSTHKYVIYKAKERQELFQKLYRPLNSAFSHGACNCMASAYQRFFDADGQIPVASTPATILWASRDYSHRKSDKNGLAKYAPNSDWIEVPDTGHHLELENPKAIASAIRLGLGK